MPNQFPSPRQWGTRFDSLPSSSPSPSPKSEGAPVQDYPISDARTVELDASFVNRKHEKMPHDASVFVGSLPPHIDNNELVRLLSGHLAEHAEVKCVKVIRDNKGGACAFVQCQDAASAARLIHTLHSNPPKPFMGRHLRYEQARAFRTLLISYCTPQHHVVVPEHSAEARNISGNATIELDLPRAMRISRSRQSRTQTIHYNEVAVELERKARQTQEPSIEQDLHMEPLMFDEKALRTICTHFGTLEAFQHYWPSDTFSEGLSGEEIVKWTLFPAPHNSPRKSVMDNHVFEVKWEHRDDCVNALMTLRKVPHLKVTWAHATMPSHFDHSGRLVHSTLHKNTDYPLTQRSRHGNSYESLESSTHWKPDVQEADQANVSAWSESDFPPLRDAEEGSMVMFSSKTLEDVHSVDPVAAGTEMCNYLEVASAAVVSCPSTLSGGIELDLPAAPALTTSPTTPRSPTSTFLLTPTSIDGSKDISIREVDSDDNSFRFHDSRTSMERVVDTSTLFVGGLDMHGPGAWDEAKLQNYFQRFGGLQNVKIVRPASGKAAFAFVKFNNTESAARAIQQEHNRVYQGRAMRVQFRECNPSRATFMRGRGRGRFLANHPPRQGLQPQHTLADRSLDSLSDMSLSSADKTRTEEFRLPTAESSNVLPETAGPDGLVEGTQGNFPEKHDSVDFPNLCQSSSPPPVQPERYREWYELDVHSQETHSTDITPLPSTPLSGSESSVPSGTVYPIPPTAGYYPPPPWVQPYPPQVQYSMPYLPGYPIYPIPNPTQPPYTNPSGSDGNGTTSTAPNHWPIYGPIVPYPAPYHLRPPHTAEQSTPPPHAQSQPPVVPSGFIQGEQGTLIAVYRQDALDHYMHQTANGNLASPQSQVQPPRIWSQYPQPSPYPPTVPPLRISPVPGYVQVPKQTGGNAPCWVPHPGGGPPLVGLPINANANVSREYDGHGNMSKRGRRDGGFHPRHGYLRQGTHRQGRRETHVPAGKGGYGEENCSEFATNAANGNVGNYNASWAPGRREPTKSYHLHLS